MPTLVPLLLAVVLALPPDARAADPLPDPAAVERALSPDGLLSRDEDADGRIVVRLVARSGALVVRTLTAEGRVVGERVLGSVLDLPVVARGWEAGGRRTRLAQDASGALVRYRLDGWGRPVDAAVAESAPGL